MKRSKQGFTLVELLVVIAIIGVLASMITLAAGDSTAKAKAAQIVGNFKILSSALTMYIADSIDAAPTATYFNAHSKDYTSAGAALKKFTVTSSEISTNSGKFQWTAEYKDAKGFTKDVQAAIKRASMDLGMTGVQNGVKMRIY